MKNLVPHQFAFWCPTLSFTQLIPGKQYSITQKELVRRVSSIVRLRIHDTCILFDRIYNVQVSIIAVESKQISTVVLSVHKTELHMPSIVALLPVLKKDDLSTAVADLTAVGISGIQLVMTETVQRRWGGIQEYERLERVIIAAAEQSKNFAVPVLYEPKPLLQEAARYTMLFYGNPLGQSLPSTLYVLNKKISTCAVLVGPEADFSVSEYVALKNLNAIPCALTPTVLRAHLAITIMAAFVRSWYSTK